MLTFKATAQIQNTKATQIKKKGNTHYQENTNILSTSRQ